MFQHYNVETVTAHSCCLWVICKHKQTEEIRFSVLSPRTVTAWLKSSAPVVIPVCWWLAPNMLHFKLITQLPLTQGWYFSSNDLISSLSQTEGAEKPQFVLRCDVWFGQQCSAQASQDLGGESSLSAASTRNINCVCGRLTLHANIGCRGSPARQKEFTVPTRGWW